MTVCACGSAFEFDQCCGPILAGTPAATPEALMRSRYSAHVQGNLDYLERTEAPEIRGDIDRAAAERAAAEIEWLGLEILHSSENGDRGKVEFSARFRRDGRELTQHELSSFRRIDGQWFYESGKVSTHTPPRQVVKIGRNDPCPCGSGKKYKKCCNAD